MLNTKMTSVLIARMLLRIQISDVQITHWNYREQVESIAIEMMQTLNYTANIIRLPEVSHY